MPLMVTFAGEAATNKWTENADWFRRGAAKNFGGNGFKNGLFIQNVYCYGFSTGTVSLGSVQHTSGRRYNDATIPLMFRV
jgi:hypothetical protein